MTRKRAASIATSGHAFEGPAFGRAFRVTRETWSLRSDPQAVAPGVEVIATRRSASEAADLAREAAQSFPKWGFHKPTRAWWGADGGQIHRFHVAEAHAKAGLTIAVAATLAGVAVGSLVLRRRAAAGPRRAASR